MVTKRTCGLPLICLVCGDVARGINFDVMTCTSCKTFFRRHALKSQIKFRCHVKSNCEITQETRGNCSACRLNKCLSLGMDRKLVGNRFQNQAKTEQIRYTKLMKQKNIQLPQPTTLSLLQNDRSTLSTNEWNLLSNIIHAYDSLDIIPQSNYLLERQSLLPLKIRSKSSITFDVIKLFFSACQPLIEGISHFHQLSPDACRTLIRHNSVTFGTLNAIFIMREIHALDYSAFLTGCNTIYGHETMRGFQKFALRLENNGIYIKTMLLILAFSTNCSIVTPDYSEDLTFILNPISILNIENIFLTMFWKYLIYQYGYVVAIRWFDIFIKYILDVLQSMNERSNEQHNEMVETIVEETTRVLTIEN